MSTPMADVIRRLETALARHAPEVAATAVQAPVTEEDLELLRAAVSPVELPADLVTLLRWSDGFGEELWPHVSWDPVGGAALLADQYAFWRDLGKETVGDDDPGWPATWLPLSAHGGEVYVLDMSPEGPCPVLLSDVEISVCSPSLASMLEVTVGLLEAGIPLGDPEESDPENGDFAEWRERLKAHEKRLTDWSPWPFDLNIAAHAAWWPPRWRTALGLSPEPDGAWSPPTPIARISESRADEILTIEGYIQRISNRASPEDNGFDPGDTRTVPTLLRVTDVTGSTVVMVNRPDFWHWMNVDGVRGQFDVAVATAARKEAEQWIWDEGPPDVDAVAVATRPAPQGRGNVPELEPQRRR